jgi:cytochrome P450
VVSAVEETARYQSPFLSASRVAMQDVEMAGVSVRRGDVVLVSLLSANRDEERFADPDRFDVTRSPNPHLAFGHGAHLCPTRGWRGNHGVPTPPP